MEIVREVKETFLKNEQKVLQGELVGLPWHEIFPRLGNFIPVIPFATQILLTANSGVGKSHSWVGMILYSLYKLKKLHPERTYKIRFLIALLEDTRETFITRLYSMILFDKYGVRADGLTLNSMRILIPANVKERLDDVEEEINSLLAHCEILDSTYNPTGLYKWARSISNMYGTHHTKMMDFKKDDGEIHKVEVYSHYTPYDPNEQVIMIVDNLNNLQQEKEENRLLTERETINKWTRQYGRLQITKHWKFTLINIIQQSAESERPVYNQSGKIMIDKCKPSLDGLGNSKECQRDSQLIFGLFAPSRFGVAEYGGYDIAVMKDFFRSFIILKSNISETNKEIPFYFDGACSIFKELPKTDNYTELNEIYSQIKQLKESGRSS
jgi:hypothetical protein